MLDCQGRRCAEVPGGTLHPKRRLRVATQSHCAGRLVGRTPNLWNACYRYDISLYIYFSLSLSLFYVYIYIYIYMYLCINTLYTYIYIYVHSIFSKLVMFGQAITLDRSHTAAQMWRWRSRAAFRAFSLCPVATLCRLAPMALGEFDHYDIYIFIDLLIYIYIYTYLCMSVCQSVCM